MRNPVTERLRETHRVITMDLRGHGSSGTSSDYGLEAMAGDVVTLRLGTLKAQLGEVEPLLRDSETFRGVA
ncbi:MAG: alpha/beta fold hydrolase [Acidimicrobiales bacterium]